jgi:tRNA(Ile)-lysidine synthase
MIPKSMSSTPIGDGNRFSVKIMPTQKVAAVTASEAKALFSGLERFPTLVLAVSGGPDSTALMMLAARWRDSLKTPPKLIAVTVDHGLRKESKREAADVARLARRLGVAHRTLHWRGKKPATGLQAAARAARYRLLAQAARAAGAGHVLTAHTLDDQAETVLIRMSRGSGIAGLAAMSRFALVPGDAQIRLVRPLLAVAKSRLVATLRAAKVSFAEDPSNRDPRFTRARLRGLMPDLAREGLDGRRLAQLAARLKRADQAIEAAVDRAEQEVATHPNATVAGSYDAQGFAKLADEIALRLLGRAVTKLGDEGPVELAKLEALKSALESAQKAGGRRFRRSLAGAVVTLAGGKIVVVRAPPRRRRPLTTAGRHAAKRVRKR